MQHKPHLELEEGTAIRDFTFAVTNLTPLRSIHERPQPAHITSEPLLSVTYDSVAFCELSVDKRNQRNPVRYDASPSQVECSLLKLQARRRRPKHSCPLTFYNVLLISTIPQFGYTRNGSNTIAPGVIRLRQHLRPAHRPCHIQLSSADGSVDKHIRVQSAALDPGAGYYDAFGDTDDTVDPRRHLGGHPQGSAQVEDLAHEKETQADGWQGAQGRDEPQQVPGLWRNQKDAHSVPNMSRS